MHRRPFFRSLLGLTLMAALQLGIAHAAPSLQQGTAAVELTAAAEQVKSIEEQLYEALERSVAEGVAAGTADPGSVTGLAQTTAAAHTGPVFCLPTCAANDGRFLALAPNGPGLDTLSDDELDFQISVPAGATSFEIGFFDGDTGPPHWDLGTGIVDFTLFADPLADGSGTTVVATFDGSTMPNNAWVDFTVATSAAAQAPSGNFFYQLRATLTPTSANPVSAFKLRSTGITTIEIFQQPLGFIAQLASLADFVVIFPNCIGVIPPTLCTDLTTTYDGSFSFFLNFSEPQKDFIVWGGDGDRGKFDGTDKDTDDANTPNTVVPPWAVGNPGVVLEGVASGLGPATGNPPDDRSPLGLGLFLLRPPSISWNLIAPDAQVFANPNPSGNREWEQFRVTTGPFDPSQHDFATSSLPAGVYEIRLSGLDMQNLNAFYFFQPVLCVSESGEACEPPGKPFLVGDTVFFDSDGDGVQDPGDPGIPGVKVNLLNDEGEVLAMTTTGADGEYLFEVDGPQTQTNVNGEVVVIHSGIYTVEVDPSNFGPGGPLEGTEVTTAGDPGDPNRQTDQVVDDNVLTYDFGYEGCGECRGKVSRLTLQYLGSTPNALITVFGRRGPIKNDPLFSGVVQPGGTFQVVGPATGNGGFTGTVGTEIRIRVNGVENTRIHTSCSQPIFPGLVRGDFRVLAGASKHGGLLCPLE